MQTGCQTLPPAFSAATSCGSAGRRSAASSLLDSCGRSRRRPARRRPKAKQMIVCWMAGGPPHTDMFDMKPDSPDDYRGEFKPIDERCRACDVCELMPKLAKLADKYTIIRSITTMNKPGDHGRAPMYWLTGNPRLPSGTAEYPMYGSVVSKFRPGPAELPTFAVLGKIDHHINNSIAGSFLGPAFNPFIFDPLEKKDDIAKMLTPQLELPAFAKQRRPAQGARQAAAAAGRRRSADRRPRRLPADRVRHAPLAEAARGARPVEGERRDDRPLQGQPPRQVPLSLRRSAALPAGPAADRGGRADRPLQPRLLGLARRELRRRPAADSDVRRGPVGPARRPRRARPARHDDRAGPGRDGPQAASAAPTQNAGRDHWDYAQFVLAAGGGFKRGCIVGATDKLGEQVTDNFYKVESFGRTLYHLLGIDPDTLVHTLSNRPIKLIAEDAPLVKEALA